MTVTSMMFITPIAPTNKDTAATHPSSAVKVFELDVAVESRLAWFNTVKGRLETVVSFWAARMLSTSLWARLSVAEDFPWTKSLRTIAIRRSTDPEQPCRARWRPHPHCSARCCPSRPTSR